MSKVRIIFTDPCIREYLDLAIKAAENDVIFETTETILKSIV